MKALLALSQAIDRVTDFFAVFAQWAVLAACLISASNAVVRYTADYSSNAFLEVQWYLFSACVMLGAAQVLRVNEHVRVDVFYGRYSGRAQALFDLFGLTLFLLPVMILSGEMSSNAGGLIRWPAMLMLPLGFVLVLLQGFSEIIKRVAWLNDRYDGEFHYERPLQ